MTKSQSRRNFIKSTGLLASSLWLPMVFPGRNAFALNSDQQGRFFITYYVYGGMDPTLGLDPWMMPEGCDQEDMFIEYKPDEILQAGNLRLGPACKPLLPYADRSAVINGIMMSDTDNGHDVLALYMNTGNGQGKSPHLPVELCLCSESGPYGVVTNTSPYLADRKVIVSNTKVMSGSESAVDYIKILSKMNINPDNSAIDMAKKSILASEKVTKKFYEILGEFKKKDPNIEDRHTIAAAFLSGAANQSYLASMTGGLDTHSGHEKVHLKAQTENWEKIAQLLKFFKETPYGTQGESLLDRTTVMVTTEFSRTPALNAGKGKDHNPMTNSTVLIGRGVKPGVYGASELISRKKSPTARSIYMANPISYKDGQVAPTGDIPDGIDFIFPENVVMTVAEIMGADLSLFRSVDSGVKSIPGLKI